MRELFKATQDLLRMKKAHLENNLKQEQEVPVKKQEAETDSKQAAKIGSKQATQDQIRREKVCRFKLRVSLEGPKYIETDSMQATQDHLRILKENKPMRKI